MSSENYELKYKRGSMSPSDIDQNAEERPFVVQREEKNQSAKGHVKRKSIFLSIIKCVVSVLISACLLACVVASKLSVVELGLQLNFTREFPSDSANNTSVKSNNTATNIASAQCGPSCRQAARVFVMLVLVLIIPYGYSLLRGMFQSGFKRTHPWPTKRALIWGVVGSFAESAGLSLFVFGCLSIMPDADTAAVHMNAVFIIPVIWLLAREARERNREQTRSSGVPVKVVKEHKKKHTRMMIIAIVAIILQAGGLIGFVYYDIVKIQKLETILVPVSVIILSFAWCPEVRKLQIDYDLEFLTQDEDEANEEMNGHDTLSKSDYPTKGGPHLSVDRSSFTGKDQSRRRSLATDPEKVIVETNTARGKATIINSLLKVILLPLFCAVVVHGMKLVKLKHIKYGFTEFTLDERSLIFFSVQICTSFVGYHLAWLACTTTIQRLSFALPLTLATPITFVFVITNVCNRNHYMTFLVCHLQPHSKTPLIICSMVALWLGQFFATTYYAWRDQEFIMAREDVLFWLPSYNGAFLEQSLLLNRKNETTNEYFINYRELVANSSVYMCTTMYHEDVFEMEQLLHSVAGLDGARRETGRKLEAHIFFDDGVRDKTVKKYALQLISLLEKTVNVTAAQAKKIETPYGIQLKWKLPGEMMFHIHLKDNYKVKNKKRWSQVMYMSYVLDFREINKHDDAFILTTDADVRFTPDDVIALMDRMSRDPTVGAVCGRTHPLGSGPLVWYQVFDYAIGHWMLKVAEEILGTVLCSPGCFSVYRASAIKDVLPTYATHVENSMDFLTKDMGEDRWFCTLLIENGWRLEYCAAAENSTYCPDSFDEFYKQRRRWTPSTIANQVVLIQKAGEIRKNNDAISFWFIFYQVLLMISTVVGPANVIFVISTGLSYAYPAVSMHGMFAFVTLTVAVYAAVCLYFPQDFQIRLAKWLTFFYGIIMTIVLVGLMASIAVDIKKNAHSTSASRLTQSAVLATQTARNGSIFPPVAMQSTAMPPATTPLQACDLCLPLAPSNVYLLFLMAMFLTTALLHGTEGLNVIHGIWFLLCLPSGYIFLMIYSVSNLTDRSWGTREGKAAAKSAGERDPWQMLKNLWKRIKRGCLSLCSMCRTRRSSRLDGDVDMSDLASEDYVIRDEALLEPVEKVAEPGQNVAGRVNERDTDGTTEAVSPTSVQLERVSSGSRKASRSPHFEFSHRKSNVYGRISSAGWLRSIRTEELDDEDDDEEKVVKDVKDWLGKRYEMYIVNFKAHGYDDTTFLPGMAEQDLMDIGISNRGHRQKLLRDIKKLPDEEMAHEVPRDVKEWLMKLGLDIYWIQFQENSYTEPNSLADLKFMDEQTVQKTFEVEKKGHIKKLMKGIKFLQYPDSTERKIQKARAELEKMPSLSLQEENSAEFRFWDRLREACLLPEQAAFSSSEELKVKLEELRNFSLTMLAVSNIIWMTLTLTIMQQGKKLMIENTNFLGLFFLFIYTIVMFLMFISCLIHRVGTWLHLMARIPLMPGAKQKLGWSFSDEDLPPVPTLEEMFGARLKITERLANQPKERKRNIGRTESVRRRRRSVPANHFQSLPDQR